MCKVDQIDQSVESQNDISRVPGTSYFSEAAHFSHPSTIVYTV
jgi:hypothetical protein